MYLCVFASEMKRETPCGYLSVSVQPHSLYLLWMACLSNNFLMDVNYHFTQTIAHWGIRGNNYAKVGVILKSQEPR